MTSLLETSSVTAFIARIESRTLSEASLSAELLSAWMVVLRLVATLAMPSLESSRRLTFCLPSASWKVLASTASF